MSAARTHNVVNRVMADSQRLVVPYNVIDPRIDVGAQRAILRMARGTPGQRADALGMLAAVKAERLAGIYGDDLRASAQLAARLGTVRWELVPRGRDAALVHEPYPPAPPSIIFRQHVRSVPSRLDPALRGAFREFRHSGDTRNAFTLAAAGSGENPWLCAFLCAACAALIADGVPFDETALCALCLRCVAGNA